MWVRTQQGENRVSAKQIKQPILPKTPKEEPKIINLAVHLEKLTAQLDDGRELSIPIAWFAKWGVKGVSAEKLRKYEIWEGETRFIFPI